MAKTVFSVLADPFGISNRCQPNRISNDKSLAFTDLRWAGSQWTSNRVVVD
jgi:hypothetical protein